MLHTMRIRKSMRGAIPILAVALMLTGSHAPAQLPPAMPAARSVEVLGQQIQYYETGTGPAIIFLHGLGADASSWAFNMGPAGQRYHVYAPDQIGFGHSDKPLIDYKIATFVDFLKGFMQALKIPKATLVGNSLGGWIAADFAIKHPEMVESLVLVDAAGYRLEGTRRPIPVDLNPSSLVGMRRILEFVIYDKQSITDDLVRHAFEGHLKSGDGYTIQRFMAGISTQDQFEAAEKLGAIRTPTLVVWGHDDLLIPLEIGELYQKAIPGASLVVFDRCAHIPQVEKPAEFNRALLDFLAKR